MKNILRTILGWLQAIPKKVIISIVTVVIIIAFILKYLVKSTSIKAKEMNLNALIDDALTKFKLKENKKKIKDLESEPKKEDLESDPKKVEEFYKKRD